jgi:hypothetical protein
LNLPALVLKEISVFPNDWLLVTGSETAAKAKNSGKGDQRSLKIRRSELLGDCRFNTSRVVGRALLFCFSARRAAVVNFNPGNFCRHRLPSSTLCF